MKTEYISDERNAVPISTQEFVLQQNKSGA